MKNIRHRYIAFEVHASQGSYLDESSLIKVMVNKLRSNGSQPPGIRFRLIQYDSSIARGAVKISPHTATEWMKEFILSIDEISDRRVATSILGSSGTLRTIREKYLKTLKQISKSNKRFRPNTYQERDEPAVPL